MGSSRGVRRSSECYLSSIKTIDQMGEFVQDHAKRAGRPLFGGATVGGRAESRGAGRSAILPSLRGAVSSNRRVIGALRRRRGCARVCELGAGPSRSARWGRAVPIISCARASRRSTCRGTRRPKGSPELKARIARAARHSIARITPAYYKAHALPDSPALARFESLGRGDPGLGLFGFGKDKREARITSEFFVNAIHVMAGANALGARGAPTDGAKACSARRRGMPEQAADFKSFQNYVALPRSEAFRIEYWALEEAKLQRMPPETRVQPEDRASSSAAPAASAAKWRCRSRGAAGTSSSPT